MRFKNKVALITGGSGGIGFAFASKVVSEGGKVFLVDIDEAALAQSANELGQDRCAYIRADVCSSDDTAAYAQATLDKFGQIDIFFNNAGVEGVVAPFDSYPEEMFDKVIAVNVKGVWLGCKHVIPKMTEGGSVIITASVAGLKGTAGVSAYTTSKHAVIGTMRCAALEFAPRKIRVNSIHPGPVDNRMMRSLEKNFAPDAPDSVKEGFSNMIPLKRYTTNEEIAQAVAFLASDESKMITGATLVVDGGMVIV
jgi:NAD(P)-dependent dehydrogenase (short-subunit alcohol dehydrogenase family)